MKLRNYFLPFTILASFATSFAPQAQSGNSVDRLPRLPGFRVQQLYKYIITYALTPLVHFLPKNRTDWTQSYLILHPKYDSIAWYLMERHFYHGGKTEACQFVSDLYDVGYKKNSKEIKFDACLVGNFLSGANCRIPRPKLGPAYSDLSHYSEQVQHASLSQVYALLSDPNCFKSYYPEFKYLLSKFPNDPYVLAWCSTLCVMHQYAMRYNNPTANYYPSNFIKMKLAPQVGVALAEKAIKMDWRVLPAYAAITDLYRFYKNPPYGRDLANAEKERSVYLKLHLSIHNDIWKF